MVARAWRTGSREGRHECGATAGEGSFRKLDPGHHRQFLPGRGQEPDGGLHGGGGAPVLVCRQRGSGGARTDRELALRQSGFMARSGG